MNNAGRGWVVGGASHLVRHAMLNRARVLLARSDTTPYLLFSQLLQLFLHVGVLKLGVVVAADVGGVGVAGRGRGGVAVHGHGLSARRVGALLALAAAGAPQEGHSPLHQVAAAVLRQGVGRGGWVGRGRGQAAAVLVGRVRVRVALSCGVHGLGSRDVVRGEVGAGSGRGLVEVGRGRVTVAALRAGRIGGVAVGCGCCGEAACRCGALLLALGRMAARVTGTTRGSRGAVGAAAGFALLQTGNDIRWRGNDLKERKRERVLTHN